MRGGLMGGTERKGEMGNCTCDAICDRKINVKIHLYYLKFVEEVSRHFFVTEKALPCKN